MYDGADSKYIYSIVEDISTMVESLNEIINEVESEKQEKL